MKLLCPAEVRLDRGSRRGDAAVLVSQGAREHQVRDLGELGFPIPPLIARGHRAVAMRQLVEHLLQDAGLHARETCQHDALEVLPLHDCSRLEHLSPAEVGRQLPRGTAHLERVKDLRVGEAFVGPADHQRFADVVRGRLHLLHDRIFNLGPLIRQNAGGADVDLRRRALVGHVPQQQVPQRERHALARLGTGLFVGKRGHHRQETLQGRLTHVGFHLFCNRRKCQSFFH